MGKNGYDEENNFGIVEIGSFNHVEDDSDLKSPVSTRFFKIKNYIPSSLKIITHQASTFVQILAKNWRNLA